MINNLPIIMLISLSFTIIIETFFAYLFKIRGIDLIIVVLTNIVTNPLLVSISYFINIRFGLRMKNKMMIWLELLVVIIEWLIYKLNLKNKNPLRLAIILNILSYFIGEILNKIIY